MVLAIWPALFSGIHLLATKNKGGHGDNDNDNEGGGQQ